MTRLNLIISFHGLRAENIATGTLNALVANAMRRKERRNLDSLGYLGNDIKVIGAMNIFTNITSRNRAGSRDLVPDKLR
mgnify:CR=1 FL=1